MSTVSRRVCTSDELNEELGKVFHKLVPDLVLVKRDGFSYSQLYHFARVRIHQFPILQRRR